MINSCYISQWKELWKHQNVDSLYSNAKLKLWICIETYNVHNFACWRNRRHTRKRKCDSRRMLDQAHVFSVFVFWLAWRCFFPFAFSVSLDSLKVSSKIKSLSIVLLSPEQYWNSRGSCPLFRFDVCAKTQIKSLSIDFNSLNRDYIMPQPRFGNYLSPTVTSLHRFWIFELNVGIRCQAASHNPILKPSEAFKGEPLFL